MQCANCGRPLRPSETICPNCGEPVAPDAEQPTAAASLGFSPHTGYPTGGPPVDPYAPTLYGPPIGPDRYGASAVAPTVPAVERYVGGYRTVRPPASGRRRRSGCVGLVAGVVALGVVALLFVGALAASGQRLGPFPFGFGGTSPHPTVTRSPTATAIPTCTVATVDPQAATKLMNVRLTTGLRDPEHLLPINSVTTLTVGQTAYVTFQIATNEAGTVGAAFCTGGVVTNGVRDVPQGYRDAHGEFHLQSPLTAADVGQGVVALTWDGAVAAVLPFKVMAA